MPEAVKSVAPLPINPEAKIYVLDTSTILNSPGIIDILQDNVIIIPIWVVEELDNKKKGISEVARIARNFSKLLDKYRQIGKLTDGVQTEASGLLYVGCEMADWKELPEGMQNNNDNRIIMVAKKWRQDYPERRVIVLSCDVNQRIKADVVGLEAQDYKHNETNYLLDCLYTDITRVELNPDQGDFLVELYQKPYCIPEDKFTERQLDNLHPNECCYLCVGNKTAPVIYKAGSGFKLVPKPKLAERDGSKVIKTVGIYQAFAAALLADETITNLSFDGVPGAGKSVIPIHWTLTQIAAGNYEKLLIFRPYDFGGMGFLKGSADEKFAPYTDAMLDRIHESLISLDAEGIKFFKNKGINTVADLKKARYFEVLPIDFIEGQTYNNAVIIVEEAQNYTPKQVYLLCTRAGIGCRLIIDGDLGQAQNRDKLDENGLIWVVKEHVDHPNASHLSMRKNVRGGPSMVYSHL